jgi:hypothetical protein
MFVAYSLWYLSALQAIPEVYSWDSKLKVNETTNIIELIPTGNYENVLIFYPGAFVDPAAYLPLCGRLTKHNIKCIIVKMPLRSAVFGYTKPMKEKLLQESDKKYVLAGHSHGAEMAARFVYEFPGVFNKLILLGTRYPANYSLAESDAKVLKIYASEDGIELSYKVEQNKSKLPENTRYVLIEGGNHAQFGYYKFQPGDYPSKISRKQQQELVFNEMLRFIKDLPDDF